jgi:uncharacterized protein (TIGR03435 family)
MGIRMRFATACVRAWTWLYTLGLPRDERFTRRNEIESDLWEFECDDASDHSFVSDLHILIRLVIGIPDDLGWRIERASVAGTLTQQGAVLTGRVVGAVLFICALYVIDVDSSRNRPAHTSAAGLGVLGQESEETMAMRAEHLKGRKLPLLMAGIMATVGASRLSGQSPAFEVASVRPNNAGYMSMRLDSQPGGRVTGTNVTAATLIRFAYDMPDFQMFGGPNWINSDRFDVIAKAENDAPLDQKRLMMRRLLAERFKLTAHTETRELAIYALTISSGDRRLGPRLRRTDSNCGSAGQPLLLEVGPSPAGGPPTCGFFGFAPGTKFSEARGGLAFRGLTMAELAKVFRPILRRSVVDRTALTGYFDGDFDFIAEFPVPPPPPGMPNPFDAPFASVFTVFPNQLGLKLESTRGPVDVLVIDSVERPTPE